MVLNEMDITRLLQNFKDKEATHKELFPLVYDQLLLIAKNVRFQWQGNFTMNATSLVHEAYIKMVRKDELNIENRRHFFAIAAQAMKQILVNYAKRKKAKKRGEELPQIDPDKIKLPIMMTNNFGDNLLDLCDALERLKQMSERQSQVVHYRFFTGLTLKEIAELLDISDRTVKRDWNAAKVWLYQYMRA
ncbi:MAG: ECF-type sigma factor [Saprospiraceae bacterium]|nr:ECF-type sigma factor [Saprospiraceae bacterium]